MALIVDDIGSQLILARAIIFIHSFIQIEHLYSASPRKLLRGAPDFSTAKRSLSKKKQAYSILVVLSRPARRA